MKKSTERDDVLARQEGRDLASGNGGGESRALSETGGIPDPEVEPRARPRCFSAAYKARIVEEADSCSERGVVTEEHEAAARITVPPTPSDSPDNRPLRATESGGVSASKSPITNKLECL